MELHLDRKLSEKRIFPAIDMNKSGTRREDLLLNKDEWEATMNIRRKLGNQGNQDIAESLLNLLVATKSNQEFIEKVNKAIK